MSFQPLASLPVAALAAGAGIVVRTGPFTWRLRSRLREFIEDLVRLYGEHPAAPASDIPFADFDVAITPARGIRRFILPNVDFWNDGFRPYAPLPREQATPLLEWGLNACLHGTVQTWLIIHAASIERNGRAVILPAPPGSGKSTLCAGLVSRGWRLLSDELALVSLEDVSLAALARPISLKNRSIEVMRRFAPDAVFSREAHDTAKGTVALMRPPPESVRRIDERARAAWVVFPRWQSGEPATFVERSKAATFIEIGRNAFNYSILGARGFDTLARIIDDCACYDFRYGDLDEAIGAFDRLAAA